MHIISPSSAPKNNHKLKFDLVKYRILSPILRGLFRAKSSYPVVAARRGDNDSPLVFLPYITTTYTPLLEADYNLHKSNSTYFTDLDASRSHLLSHLFCRGILIVDQELAADGKQGMMAAIIGSVTTSFKKEIRIFQQYEVWSRILTWDQKWLYIVTHFVQKGSVKHFDLAPHMLSPGKCFDKCASTRGDKNKGKSARPVIFATSVSKYVFKKGRLTVAPERLLKASGLLGESIETGGIHVEPQNPQPKITEGTLSEKFRSLGNSDNSQVIEKERLRGMKYANAWAELDSLNDMLRGESEPGDFVPVIGNFGDITGYGISYR